MPKTKPPVLPAAEAISEQPDPMAALLAWRLPLELISFVPLPGLPESPAGSDKVRQGPAGSGCEARLRHGAAAPILDRAFGADSWSIEAKPISETSGVAQITALGPKQYRVDPDTGEMVLGARDRYVRVTMLNPSEDGEDEIVRRCALALGLGRYLQMLPPLPGPLELPPWFLPDDHVPSDDRKRASVSFILAGQAYYGPSWEQQRPLVVSKFARANHYGPGVGSTTQLLTHHLDLLARRLRAASERGERFMPPET